MDAQAWKLSYHETPSKMKTRLGCDEGNSLGAVYYSDYVTFTQCFSDHCLHSDLEDFLLGQYSPGGPYWMASSFWRDERATPGALFRPERHNTSVGYSDLDLLSRQDRCLLLRQGRRLLLRHGSALSVYFVIVLCQQQTSSLYQQQTSVLSQHQPSLLSQQKTAVCLLST